MVLRQEDFTPVKTPQANAQTQMMQTRQAQEVQGAIFMAKQFPRDEWAAIERIKRACQRRTLAEQAVYSFPRGKEVVTGPSIRLAEALAQSWGNIDYGIIELERKGDSSEMMAYAWDLETNTRVTKMFKTKHWRDTRQGGYALKDERDIYEITANMGMRRVRACILGVIPGDVVEMAVEECRKTEMAEDKEPIQETLKKLEANFKKEFKVTRKQLEAFANMNLADFGKEEVFALRSVYKTLRDNQASIEDFFPREPQKAPDPLADKPDEAPLSVEDDDDLPEFMKG
ncbi:MAG: hypothetical protein GX260_05545 [Tissierellia bacterium]|nr:hypothetical protein [Tissierellia bacterium]